MERQRSDGGAAFPTSRFGSETVGEHQVESVSVIDPGMTLRDYFAGHALAGRMADPGVKNWYEHEIAAWCYRMADEMLMVRSE